jgi:hypothetical protein
MILFYVQALLFLKADKRVVFEAPFTLGIADINQGDATPEARIEEVPGHRIASLYVCLAAKRRFEEVSAARFA